MQLSVGHLWVHSRFVAALSSIHSQAEKQAYVLAEGPVVGGVGEGVRRPLLEQPARHHVDLYFLQDISQHLQTQLRQIKLAFVFRSVHVQLVHWSSHVITSCHLIDRFVCRQLFDILTEFYRAGSREWSIPHQSHHHKANNKSRAS